MLLFFIADGGIKRGSVLTTPAILGVARGVVKPTPLCDFQIPIIDPTLSVNFGQGQEGFIEDISLWLRGKRGYEKKKGIKWNYFFLSFKKYVGQRKGKREESL